MRRSRREEEFTQAPAPPLGALVTGHVRELQLTFWVIRREFQLEVFFTTEHAGQGRSKEGARLKW